MSKKALEAGEVQELLILTDRAKMVQLDAIAKSK